MIDAPAPPDGPAPRRRTLRLRDGEASALEFGDPDRPLDVIFSHANGFNALTYRSILQPLATEMRILAVDQRGHGESRLPADAQAYRRSWGIQRRDLVEVIDREARGAPVVLAGHSMGAIVSLLAAERREERVRSVVMFEPVLLPYRASLYARLPWVSGLLWKQLPMAIAARKRRSNFDRAELALASYRGRGAFRTWPDETLQDYVEGGLRPTADGFELACSPEWEAANYAAQANDSWGAMRRLKWPMTVFLAERDSSCFATPADLTRRNPLLKVIPVPGTTHFLPMERPDVVQAALRGAVRLPR
jgi:pimeloyl-ACP methyl ester carboxylesterase